MNALTQEAFKKLKWMAANMRYETTSAIAASAVSILEDRRGDYNTSDQISVPELTALLYKEPLPLSVFQKLFYKSTRSFLSGEIPGLTLSDWFFRLSHPSCASGGKLFRKWLEDQHISWFQVQAHFYIAPSDVADYGFGFLLGVGKSFSYDIVKGYYDIGEMIFKLDNLVKQGLNDFLINTYDDFLKTRSVEKATDVFDKLEKDIVNSFDPTRFGSQYGPLPAVSAFLNDMQALLFEVCRFPITEINSYKDKFIGIIDEFYYRLTKPNDDTDSADADSDAAIIWGKLRNKIPGYWSNILKKQDELLFKYEFFKAGAFIGNEITNIAQIAAGLILHLGKLGHLALLNAKNISPAIKAYVLGFSLAITAMNVQALKSVPRLVEGSPASALLFGSNISKIKNSVQLSVVERLPDFDLINLAEAAEIVPKINKELIRSLSLPTKPDTSTFAMVNPLGLLAILILKKRKDEDDLIAFFNIYKDEFRSAWCKYILSKGKPSFEADILAKLSQKSGAAAGQTPQAVVTKYTQTMADHFLKEPKTQSIIKEYTGYKTNTEVKGRLLSRLAVTFNYSLSKDLRLLFKSENEKFILLIDEPFSSLTTGVFNGKQIIKKAVLNGEQSITRIVNGKKITNTIDQIMEMSKRKFIETYNPDAFPKGYFDDLSEKLKKLTGNKQLKKLYDELIKKEKVLKEDGKSFDEIAKELEVLTEDFAYVLSKHPEAESVLTKYVGKVRLDGKVKNSRPDFMVVSLLEGSYIFDFKHGKASPEHLIGTRYYNTVNQVLFGKTLESIVVDNLYNFKL